MNVPSGAIRIFRIAERPIWVVNWPATIPGQSMATSDWKARIVRPRRATRHAHAEARRVEAVVGLPGRPATGAAHPERTLRAGQRLGAGAHDLAQPLPAAWERRDHLAGALDRGRGADLAPAAAHAAFQRHRRAAGDPV